jgi:biopolymer transport protein ExbB
MHLVERAKSLMVVTGAEWVMWLLVALSVASLAVVAERVLALRALRGDFEALRAGLVRALSEGGFAAARTVMGRSPHPAAQVALRGMREPESRCSARQAEEAMAAEVIAQRRVLERRFSFLATLGANAPFIGLFGTVVGILRAFDAMGRAGATQAAQVFAPQVVMAGIAEALVATAVGLGVAIPAVFAYNLLQRLVRSALDDAEILSHEVLSHLCAREPGERSRPRRDSTRLSSSGGEPSSRSPLRLACDA